ncbi:YpdA family putative bacillithiol disulfide reductase [Sporosarcina pasteurii]|uniref:Ferredoxin--NADP reductase n=1 Tax=Sporosarcina pasteurii TaxID=1474 RepID=A0A380BJK1_SPOPA|nr:YpdA family putative bacillithiol disulfide reductase [Sporosarcina pasteurii]MDS9470802.1 YpdA family putative bacillithiol disulfide reductase [Sporosarcina pasteurii]QBQ05529.1 YpdA family putative bacillithiol disulfide reductase [Sporosarcina pasteurii]SUJ02360.1 Ferredoxin--NADP reductase [Sporosarcina pasteurii]
MQRREVIVVGGGPCGLSAAIELKKKGIDVLVIEKGNIVNSIYRYPTHQTFFSSSLKLSIGDIPFITAKEKPKRNDALVYYREVVKMTGIEVNSFERVKEVRKVVGHFQVTTDKEVYLANFVVVATGYYDNPNRMNVKGENLPNVFHYFKEAHPYFQKDVVVIGGKNSSVDAALELERAGANVTVVYRGEDYSPSVKPWILPAFDSLIRNGSITMHFESNVIEITESTILIEKKGEHITIPHDYIFAMTGYHPDYSFLKDMGIQMEAESGRPRFDENTMETNVQHLYIAGVIAAGNNTNEIFIENGRFHGELIAKAIDEIVNNKR